MLISLAVLTMFPELNCILFTNACLRNEGRLCNILLSIFDL